MLSVDEDLDDDSIDEIYWAKALEYENFYYDEEQAEERIVLEESAEKMDRLDFENEMELEVVEEYVVDQALAEHRNANESSDIHLDCISKKNSDLTFVMDENLDLDYRIVVENEVVSV